jgi:small subunit ribosomal protein S20
MPQTKAAAKAVRADKKRRIKNDRWRRQLRETLYAVRDALKAKDKDAAHKAFVTATSALDKAARRHIIHRNKAARKKSQLASAIAKLK